VEDQQDDGCCLKAGQSDVNKLLKPVGSIDSGRFIQAGIDGGNGCQIHNRPPADFLPHAKQQQQRNKQGLTGQKHRPFGTRAHEHNLQIVDRPVYVQQRISKADNGDP
jgi:hypothetical protein